MTSYSDAQIARFLRIDPEWKPPLVDNRFMWECDELSHCRCYCTMCNNIVLNLRHEVPWNFSSNRGIPHTKHEDKKLCQNSACMFSISSDPAPITSTMVKEPKTFKKARKHKKNKIPACVEQHVRHQIESKIQLYSGGW